MIVCDSCGAQTRAIPRYARAASSGLSRVRLFRARYSLPMRAAHQELRTAVTQRIKAELLRLNALHNQGSTTP